MKIDSIEQLLKSEDHNARLSVGGKWLVWDTRLWAVYEDKPRKRYGVPIIETESIEEALKELEK